MNLLRVAPTRINHQNNGKQANALKNIYILHLGKKRNGMNKRNNEQNHKKKYRISSQEKKEKK